MLVSLVGLPGVGKSTLGVRLAKRLHLPFVDCDALIEKQLGEAIAGFFEREGEAAFRDLEEAVLAVQLALREAVVATGGGAVVRAGNRRLLHERSICLYLRADPDDLLVRLRRSSRRPLLQVADLESRLMALAHEREPFYRDAASFVIETKGRSSADLIDAMALACGDPSGCGRSGVGTAR